MLWQMTSGVLLTQCYRGGAEHGRAWHLSVSCPCTWGGGGGLAERQDIKQIITRIRKRFYPQAARRDTEFLPVFPLEGNSSNFLLEADMNGLQNKSGVFKEPSRQVNLETLEPSIPLLVGLTVRFSDILLKGQYPIIHVRLEPQGRRYSSNPSSRKTRNRWLNQPQRPDFAGLALQPQSSHLSSIHHECRRSSSRLVNLFPGLWEFLWLLNPFSRLQQVGKWILSWYIFMLGLKKATILNICIMTDAI